MAMLDHTKSKFRFSETFNNSDGKTSGSGFIGVLMGLIAILGFIAGSVGWFVGQEKVIDYLELVLQLGLLSAALMGVRKFSAVFGKKDRVEELEEGDDEPNTDVPVGVPVEEQG